MLAGQVAMKINEGKRLSPPLDVTDSQAQQLKMIVKLAEREDEVVRARAKTDAACWFTSLRGVYNRANAEEIQVLDNAARSPFKLLSAPVHNKNRNLARTGLCVCQGRPAHLTPSYRAASRSQP